MRSSNTSWACYHLRFAAKPRPPLYLESHLGTEFHNKGVHPSKACLVSLSQEVPSVMSQKIILEENMKVFIWLALQAWSAEASFSKQKEQHPMHITQYTAFRQTNIHKTHNFHSFTLFSDCLCQKMILRLAKWKPLYVTVQKDKKKSVAEH